MVQALIIALTLLSAANTADVVVVTLPAKGDVALTLGANGKVELKRDLTITHIRIELDRLQSPSAMGPAFGTYVAWSVSPEGDVENIGELAMEKDKGRLDVTSRFEQSILFT